MLLAALRGSPVVTDCDHHLLGRTDWASREILWAGKIPCIMA